MKEGVKLFKHQSGFTLIETLVYLALFTIIIGGTMVTVYQVIEASGAQQAKTILQEEGNFILAKLNWALTGAIDDTEIASPTLVNSSDRLTINNAPGSTLRFEADLNNGNIRFNSGGGLFELNSDRVSVSTTTPHIFSQPTDNKIQANFTLNTLSRQGKLFSQNFELTKYLR